MSAENSETQKAMAVRKAGGEVNTSASEKKRGFGGLFKKIAAADASAQPASKPDAQTESAQADADQPAQPEGPKEIVSLLETLAVNQQMLDEEYARLKAGDFSHTDLYACRKRKAVAYLERLLTRAEPLMEDIDPKLRDQVYDRAATFRRSLESNLRLIDSTRQAVAQILAQTLKLVEKHGGDGVYTKAGERLASEQFSATGMTAKL